MRGGGGLNLGADTILLTIMAGRLLACLSKKGRKQNWLTESIRLPQWLRGKESACQCRRHGFDPWARKIPHAKEQQSVHNDWACALKPGSDNYCARMLQLLKPASPKAHALEQEKPPSRETCALRLEKSQCSNKDPAQPKINKIKKIKEREST